MAFSYLLLSSSFYGQSLQWQKFIFKESATEIANFDRIKIFQKFLPCLIMSRYWTTPWSGFWILGIFHQWITKSLSNSNYQPSDRLHLYHWSEYQWSKISCYWGLAFTLTSVGTLWRGYKCSLNIPLNDIRCFNVMNKDHYVIFLNWVIGLYSSFLKKP